MVMDLAISNKRQNLEAMLSDPRDKEGKELFDFFFKSKKKTKSKQKSKKKRFKRVGKK